MVVQRVMPAQLVLAEMEAVMGEGLVGPSAVGTVASAKEEG